MPPIGGGHAGHHHRVRKYLTTRYDDRFVIFGQSTLVLAEGFAVDPDLAVFRDRPDSYAHAEYLRAEDCLLVVEIADSSIAYDTGDKAGFYAAAGIPEYWVVDVRQRELAHFAEPGPAGYRAKRTHEVEASFSSPLLGLVSVGDLFPPPPPEADPPKT